jgi:hypothetical protein
MLRTKGKSPAQIFNEFRRIPKVTGGTDFQQVWDYINASNVRRRRLSLMVTDFAWSPPPLRLEHPPNLHYAPCSRMDWDDITSYADGFVTNMRFIDPLVQKKLIGLAQ